MATERLRLRPVERDDAAALGSVYGRPEVARYLLHEPWAEAETSTQIDKRVVRTGLRSEARALALAIETDGVVIGDLALWHPSEDDRAAEIGWVLDPGHAGRGFATEAVAALLTLAFEHYRLHRVSAQMDERNQASARLAQRVGMVREAHLRQDWWSKGEWTDTLIFGMLATDRQN